MESLGERVRRLRKALGLKQGEVVRNVPGMTPSALSQIESGKTKELRGQNLVDLARALQTTPEELAGNVLMEPRSQFARTSRSAKEVRDVPIIGFAVATPDRDGYFTDGEYPVGHGEGFIPWPTKDPNAYALRVKGDSMQPRIRPGELIIIEPNIKAELMDDVLVRTRDGRKMVKQLLSRRAGEVTFGSINQAHQQQTISVEQIESIHFVTAIVPRGANVKETRDPLEGTW